VAEVTPKGGVPAAVRALLQERAGQGTAIAPPPAAEPSELVQPAEPETVGIPEQRSLAELKEALQREWYGILLEPEVSSSIRRLLRSRDPKVVRDLLGVMLPVLFPNEKAGTGGRGSKIVFISKIDRSGANTTAAKIETPPR